tara:strand:- start:70 stop:360 length:291 start_codon:yes stop_codon:yes gene_type:complete
MDNVIVRYFGATWCGPCKKYKPVVKKLEQAGYPIMFHDIDQDPVLAESHRIMSVPQVKIEVDGKVVETMVGIQPVDVLLGKINIYYQLNKEENNSK